MTEVTLPGLAVLPLSGEHKEEITLVRARNGTGKPS